MILFPKFQAGMQSVFHSDLTRAMDLIYGLLHQDVVGCTLSLLVHALPLYISGPCTGWLSLLVCHNTWLGTQKFL